MVQNELDYIGNIYKVIFFKCCLNVTQNVNPVPEKKTQFPTK